MLHRLDDVRAESEHRMPGAVNLIRAKIYSVCSGRYIAPQPGGFNSMRGHENNKSRRDVSARQPHLGQDNSSFVNRH